MGQASVTVVVVMIAFSVARAVPLIEERSGAGKRRSSCRGDVASAARLAPLIEERSGAGKRHSGCCGDVVLSGPCSTTV